MLQKLRLKGPELATANTARKAFANAEVFSQIAGIDIEVINRLRTILFALSSGHELNIDEFKQFCCSTSEYLVRNYAWYEIPPSVHKMLEHGYQVAAKLDLPIGLYSEEAQEAQNREIRRLDSITQQKLAESMLC